MTPVVTAVERPGDAGDVGLVFNSWLKGSRSAFPEMHTSDYFDLQHARIERLLLAGRLVVLHPEGKPLVICAWALLDPGPEVAHYVHVRGEYRRQGFASRLLAGRTVATHLTEQGHALKRKLGLRYMPHLLDAT
jgi:GNAT superfamily N-acetyltransferase